MKLYKSIILIFCISLLPLNLFAGDNWKIIVGNKLQSDEAIKVALEDLVSIGHDFGITGK